LICINAAIAQERPVSPRLLALSRVALGDEDLFFLAAGFGKDLPEGICNKGMPPKFQTRIAVGRVSFVAEAINHRDEGAVGNGVRALNRSPCIELGGAELGLLLRVPSDTGGIKNDLRSLERGQARAFGIPLIPANLHADTAVLCIEIRKSQVARREVKFFVVERVVRNMHLAVLAEEGSVGVKNRTGVVIHAGGSSFEKGNDQRDLVFLGNF